MGTAVNHIAHGRALLAMRIPATRHAITTSADAAEICEHYSLAVLYRRQLVAKGSSSIYIAQYELLIRDLETEAAGILV